MSFFFKTTYLHDPEKWLIVRTKLQSTIVSNSSELKALLQTFADLFEQQLPSANFGFIFEIWERRQQALAETFFSSTLPKITRLCLDSESLFQQQNSIRLLSSSSSSSPSSSSSSSSIELSVHQCASLLACAFFGVAVNPCDYFGHNECHSRFSLTFLTTERASDMMRAILLYFENINIDEQRKISMRLNRLSSTTQPQYSTLSNDKLLNVVLNRDDGVDDVSCQLVADFANELIGGGVMGGIRAQEGPYIFDCRFFFSSTFFRVIVLHKT